MRVQGAMSRPFPVPHDSQSKCTASLVRLLYCSCCCWWYERWQRVASFSARVLSLSGTGALTLTLCVAEHLPGNISCLVDRIDPDMLVSFTPDACHRISSCRCMLCCFLCLCTAEMGQGCAVGCRSDVSQVQLLGREASWGRFSGRVGFSGLPWLLMQVLCARAKTLSSIWTIAYMLHHCR